MEETKITKEMTIAEILEGFPHQSQRLAQVLTNAGLHCVGCGAATWETLEGGILGHGKTEEELHTLIEKLNAILGEKLNLDTISITTRAATKIQEISEEDGKAGWALRFGDAAGGCGGFEYILDFCKNPDEDDAVFESEGVTIVVKKGMLKRLVGSVIDYVDGLYGAGFKISNPNVKSACGCGKSQGY